MEIELSEDLQHYKESIAMGLNAKQLIYSILSIGAGAGTVLLLYDKIGITASCYVATPIVTPLALTGFYNYNGLTFWQHMKKIIKFSFFNRPLVFYNRAIEEMKTEYVLYIHHVMHTVLHDLYFRVKRFADEAFITLHTLL